MRCPGFPPVDRIILEDEKPYDGPLWSPTYYHGQFPSMAGAGDIYANLYKDPPLYYVFFHNGRCEPISLEEIEEWVTGGLMTPPTLVQPENLPGRITSPNGKKPGASPGTPELFES